MKHENGFTLIELLVYIALTSILIAIMSQVFLATVAIRLESQNTTSVQQDARYMLSRISYDIRRATAINAPSLGQQASAASMLIHENGADMVYAYSLSGTDLILTVGTQSAQLNSDGSQVTSLSISRMGNSATLPEAKDTLSIMLTLSDSGETQINSQTLQMRTTVGLR
jgi:prepilin-type N-terminal cleavage/methylation domain-containing protein